MLITVLLCQQCTVSTDILQSKAVHAQNFSRMCHHHIHRLWHDHSKLFRPCPTHFWYSYASKIIQHTKLMLQQEPLCNTQICCYQNAHEAPVKQLPRASHVTTRITGESKVTRTSHIHQVL